MVGEHDSFVAQLLGEGFQQQRQLELEHQQPCQGSDWEPEQEVYAETDVRQVRIWASWKGGPGWQVLLGSGEVAEPGDEFPDLPERLEATLGPEETVAEAAARRFHQLLGYLPSEDEFTPCWIDEAGTEMDVAWTSTDASLRPKDATGFRWTSLVEDGGLGKSPGLSGPEKLYRVRAAADHRQQWQCGL